MKKFWSREVGFEGNTNMESVSKSTICCMEWQLELDMWTKTILTRVSEFLMCCHELKQQGEFWRQRAGKLWDAVRRFCVENECICFSVPIKGESKTTKTSCSLTRFDTYKPEISRRLLCDTRIEYSSSTWSSTSKRWWSDWNLEIKGLSSERCCALSTLVWWNVVEYIGNRRRK